MTDIHNGGHSDPDTGSPLPVMAPMPPPTSRAGVIAALTFLGQSLKVVVNTAEANIDAWFPGKKFLFGLAHWLLNSAGYTLEDATGVPDGTYGAGGTSKGSGGGGGG